MENEELWERMGERLNINPAKHPLIEPVLELLESKYTVEQAELIADYPLGAFTAKELAEKLNRDEAQVKRLVEEMDANLTIFTAKRENGETEYSVLPFEFGLFEPTLILAKPGDAKAERHKKIIENIFQAEEDALRAFFQNAPEMAKAALSNPHMRYFPVEEVVPGDGSEIVPDEKISDILSQNTKFAMAKCGCRALKLMEGHKCQQDAGEDDYCCLQVGKLADWLVEKGLAKRMTKEEALAKVQKFKEAGMLQMGGSYYGGGGFCNCCKCCCFHRQMGSKMREFGVKLAKNVFVAQLDAEKCVGCGACVTICPMDALTMSGEKVALNQDVCAGEGHCVAKCPTGALSLSRVAETHLHDHAHPFVGAGY